MRRLLITALGVAFIGANAAYAQAVPAQPQTPQPPAVQETAPAIQRVTVVDITELPAAAQEQVNTVVAQQSEGQLDNMRQLIDGSPQAKSALEAEGMSSAQVIATSMDGSGTLTLITKKDS